jgi:hypothetical protein
MIREDTRWRKGKDGGRIDWSVWKIKRRTEKTNWKNKRGDVGEIKTKLDGKGKVNYKDENKDKYVKIVEKIDRNWSERRFLLYALSAHNLPRRLLLGTCINSETNEFSDTVIGKI